MNLQKWGLRILTGAILFGAGLMPLFALQDQPDQKTAPEYPQVQRGPHPENEVQQLIEALYISRMQEDLKLTDEQYAAVIPTVKNFLRVRQESARQRHEAEMELNRMLDSGAPNEQIQTQMNEIERIRKQSEKDMDAARNEINSKLNIRQQALFLQYQKHIDQQINRMILQIREGRRMQRMERNIPRPQGMKQQALPQRTNPPPAPHDGKK